MSRNAAGRKKGERTSEGTNANRNPRTKEMPHPWDSLVFPLATLVVVVAVYVAPLTAVSTCKYAKM